MVVGETVAGDETAMLSFLAGRAGRQDETRSTHRERNPWAEVNVD